MAWQCSTCMHYTADGMKHRCINDELEKTISMADEFLSAGNRLKDEVRKILPSPSMEGQKNWTSHQIMIYNAIQKFEEEIADIIINHTD